jgi:hypothetical protein
VVARTKEEAQNALNAAKQRNLGYSNESSSKRSRNTSSNPYDSDDPYSGRDQHRSRGASAPDDLSDRDRVGDDFHRDDKRHRSSDSELRRAKDE